MAMIPEAKTPKRPTVETLAPGAAAPGLAAENVPALFDEGLAVVLVRTGVVLGVVVVVEVLAVGVVGVVAVAVVLGLTPATVQYWVDWAWYCLPWSTSSAQPL